MLWRCCTSVSSFELADPEALMETVSVSDVDEVSVDVVVLVLPVLLKPRVWLMVLTS
jgi:hypothetical protein